MKIGIVTFHNADNFGAVLQAYALQHYLYINGHDVEIIDFRLKNIDESYALIWKPNSYLDGFKKSILHPFYRLLKSVITIIIKPFKIRRRINFISFRIKYLNISSRYPSNKKNFKHDIIICGSDQIWNPVHTREFRPEYFGQIGQCSKKISYAASMGEYSLQQEDGIIFKKLLNQLDYISVREEAAQQACIKYTNKSVKCVLDPVFLLDEKEWDEAIPTNKYDNSDYILVYNILKDEKIIKNALQLRDKYGYKIIEIEVKDSFKDDAYTKICSAGPKDFIELIKNAKIVLTSSFHGTAFSIIFKKTFYASKVTRIENLLKQINLENRLVSNLKLSNEDVLMNIDYQNVTMKLNKLINESKNFLINSIESK